MANRIVLITGSPRNGNSAAMAYAFEQAAKKRGNEVIRFDANSLYVEGCRACGQCYKVPGIACRLTDDFNKIADAVFACIVCGNDRKGARYAARLKKFLTEEKYAERDRYFNSGKSHLQIEILAEWYTASEEELETMFDKETVCGVCHHCTSAVCREMEGMRILFLLRQGKTEEARMRLLRNLEIQPADEYMLAIKHTVFNE